MKIISTVLVSLLVSGFSLAQAEGKKTDKKAAAKEAPAAKKEEAKVTVNPNIVLVDVETSMGTIKLELNKEKAPKSVENFVQYVTSGHYEGTLFHRVKNGFMIQGGGMTTKMTEKTTRSPVENEAKNGLKNEKYTLAMARTNDPNSATAQFFVNTENNSFLDYSSGNPGYAVFGKVAAGTEIVDKIAKVRTGNSGMHEDVPVEQIVIKSAKVVTK